MITKPNKNDVSFDLDSLVQNLDPNELIPVTVNTRKTIIGRDIKVTQNGAVFGTLKMSDVDQAIKDRLFSNRPFTSVGYDTSLGVCTGPAVYNMPHPQLKLSEITDSIKDTLRELYCNYTYGGVSSSSIDEETGVKAESVYTYDYKEVGEVTLTEENSSPLFDNAPLDLLEIAKDIIDNE